MTDIEITATSRGFHEYGKEVTCTYGNSVQVYESSSAMGPRVWLRVVDKLGDKVDDACAHLNEEQAREVIARLQAWVDEIPSRWGE